MLSSENLVDIHLTKRDGEQVHIEKLNPHHPNKVMGFWKNPLTDMTNHKTELQKKIQEWNNLL